MHGTFTCFFNDISTPVGYSMPKATLQKDISATIELSAGEDVKNNSPPPKNTSLNK